MATPSSTFLVNRFTLVGVIPQEYVIDLEPFNLEGFFSLQGKGTVSPEMSLDPIPIPVPWPGEITVTFLVSNDGVNFFSPFVGNPIMSGLGDGEVDFASFSPPNCRYLKLVFTPDDDVEADFWISMS
jgi:hypothetical protein